MTKRTERETMRDRFRLRVAVAYAAMWGGWLGSAALGLWSILEYDPNHGHFAPQWVGLVFIFLIGVAIAGSAASSRYKMADTIVGAFKAGLEGAKMQDRPAQDDVDDQERSQ